jgi:hypothetical protein
MKHWSVKDVALKNGMYLFECTVAQLISLALPWIERVVGFCFGPGDSTALGGAVITEHAEKGTLRDFLRRI